MNAALHPLPVSSEYSNIQGFSYIRGLRNIHTILSPPSSEIILFIIVLTFLYFLKLNLDFRSFYRAQYFKRASKFNKSAQELGYFVLIPSKEGVSERIIITS